MRFFSTNKKRQVEKGQSVRQSAQPTRRSLELESLEERMLLACSIGFKNGILTITGAQNADVAVAYEVGQKIVAKLDCNGSNLEKVVSAKNVKQIVFYGYNGNDIFANGTSKTSLAMGGGGNDQLYGGSGSDNLMGEAGNDTMNGGAGSDAIWGGTGLDEIYGENGDDWMDGGDDQDVMDGGDGNDTMYGQAGNDVLVGGDGDDVLDGGLDNDVIFGGNGSDTASGGDGDDILFGEGFCFVGPCFSNPGNDVLNGGAGKDNLYGQEGDDVLEGGYDGQHDLLDGGSGKDTFVYYIKPGDWFPTEIDQWQDFVDGVDAVLAKYV
jgi:Ca2+-binding RTX toxin-like protein